MNFNFLLHPFVTLSAMTDKAIAPAPLDKTIPVDMKIAQKKIINFDHTIRLQQFGKHMAQAEIQAMINWVELERKQNLENKIDGIPKVYME